MVFLYNPCLWEITIEASIGKLKLKASLLDSRDYLFEKGIKLLEFDYDDPDILLYFPFLHLGPFGRLIFAQAKS